ncbi:MAG: hypothetical protein IKQ91_08485 [Oscillospiraceae bacterium]|nr:hypothetical protein [Oscillospiraceae bacterium]
MNPKKSILLWSACLAALFLAVTFVLEQFCELKMRVWLRESATILIAAGAAIGILQLVLHIPNKTAKLICAMLWVPAVIAFGIYGYVLYAFLHPDEAVREWNGTKCIVETEQAFEDYTDYYYEYRNWFVRGTKLLDTDCY